jgi:hypothetical protein
MHFFLDADPEYAAWTACHPDGYVIDVRAPARGSTQTIHRAHCLELATPTALGGTVGLPRRHARACSTDRAELEAWADWAGYGLVYCRDCECEADWLAEYFGAARAVNTADLSPA